jgi:hypothetical protein
MLRTPFVCGSWNGFSFNNYMVGSCMIVLTFDELFLSRYCTQPQIRFIMSTLTWTTTLENITLMINLDNYFISVPQYSSYPNWNGAYLIYSKGLFRLQVYTIQLYERQLAFRATSTARVIGIMPRP